MIKKNNKAINVSSQLLECLIDVTIVTQIIKHVTGRESSYKSSEKSGKWRWFPNQKKYHKNVPKYDAFPSGHLATTMLIVAILSENYPNNPYIIPIGYTVMSLLSFQMMNNEVHWASDYPLVIVIGYTFGKIISSREKENANSNLSFMPILTNEYSGMALNFIF